MMEKTARATEKAVQRCIDAACGATFGLRERIYVCAHCGGTLEIESPPQSLRNATGDPASLRKRCSRHNDGLVVQVASRRNRA